MTGNREVGVLSKSTNCVIHSIKINQPFTKGNLNIIYFYDILSTGVLNFCLVPGRNHCCGLSVDMFDIGS